MTSIHDDGGAPPPDTEDPSLVNPNDALAPIDPSEEPMVPDPEDDEEDEYPEGVQAHNPWIARGGIAVAVVFLAGAGYAVLNRGNSNPPPAPAFAMPANQPAPLPPSVSYPDPSQQGQPPAPAIAATQALPAEPERPPVASPSQAQGPAPVPSSQVPPMEPVKATLDPAVAQTLQADLSALKDRVATLEQRQKAEPKVAPAQRSVPTTKHDEKPKAAVSTPKEPGQRINAQLQAVVPGQAWVNLNGAVHVVHVGDALPGAGVVQKIDTESFRVTTTTGVIE